MHVNMLIKYHERDGNRPEACTILT